MSLQLSIRKHLNLVDIKKINLLHIFIFSILLMVIGYSKNKTPKILFYLLGLMTLLILLFVPPPQINPLNISYWGMIHWLHYAIVLPILSYYTYLGLSNKKISNNSYDGLFAIGLFVFIYHIYKYSKK